MSRSEYTPVDIPVMLLLAVILIAVLACVRSCQDLDRPVGISHQVPPGRYGE